MKKEIKSILKKTAKIAGVTCVTTGAIALIASGTALKATAEGFKHIQNSVRNILAQQEETEAVQMEE